MNVIKWLRGRRLAGEIKATRPQLSSLPVAECIDEYIESEFLTKVEDSLRIEMANLRQKDDFDSSFESFPALMLKAIAFRFSDQATLQAATAMGYIEMEKKNLLKTRQLEMEFLIRKLVDTEKAGGADRGEAISKAISDLATFAAPA